MDNQKDQAASSQRPHYQGKHKMNKTWTAAADQVKSLVPGGAGPAEAGIQKMFDAIEDAGTDPNARLQAALTVFASNTTDLRDAIHATGSSAEEGAQFARALLSHTMNHFAEIQHSVIHGHRKD